MITDHHWVWSILLAGGKRYLGKGDITLTELLKRFYDAGGQETEIEAVIRH